ncbi:MAG TPA: S8/S53 family peptidase [Ktedonobacteraceae bacterium]|nr:S8/S53 family peptidase [Ktedonobacteraceae bacterium]
MARSSIELMGTPDGLFYWIPGEMVVVARLHRHPATETQEILVEQIRAQLNALLVGYGILLEAYGTAGRWQDAAPAATMRRSFIFGRHRQQPLIAVFFHARQVNPSMHDATPLALSYIQSNLEQLAQSGLHIVSAMPNWLVSAAPFLYSSGGPAMPPVPAPELDVPASTGGLPGWRVSFADAGLPLHPNGAEDVVVAVLDTAHHPERIRAAVTRPDLRRNWLLQQFVADLRNENGLFEIEYDRYPIIGDVCTGQDFYGEPRYYFMPDHGLFVAGLVRDIAPRARIRLIRILNDFGAGDTYNLFAALTDLEQDVISGSIRRLVVNLSLCVMPDIRRLPYVWFDNRQWPSTQLSSAVRVLAHIEEGLRLLFESMHAQGVLIVAAAGNESLPFRKQGQKPRPPRAPARYETTLSVTSVNSRYAAAQFANIACLPPLDAGIATFGGDIYGATDANGLPDAVRGLYISPTFPNGEQNLTGWADWRGTSFSTAIISALGAHLMAQNWSAPQAITRIAAGRERRTDKLYGASPDIPELLANVIRVQQRFGV